MPRRQEPFMSHKLVDYRFDRIPAFLGQELGVSEWMTLEQWRIDEFAHCTGDDQWIHTDPDRCARESPYGVPIAHGFLTLSLLAQLMNDLKLMPEGTTLALNAGINNVRFKSVVRVGSRIRVRVKLAAVTPNGPDRLLTISACALEVEGEKDPALLADIVVLLCR
jgi:acyl dehydratase